MKNIIKTAGVAVAAIALAQTVQATAITGAIGFGGDVAWDTGSAATATQVVAWYNTQVISDSGAFKSYITPVAPAAFTTTTWNLNDPSTVIANFWSAGGFTFTLDSSQIISHGGVAGVNGFVVVDGMGVVSGNGYDNTVMSWSFTAQDPQSGIDPAEWTFSASTVSNVPDGGATVMLLGLALSGVALLKKKLTA